MRETCMEECRDVWGIRRLYCTQALYMESFKVFRLLNPVKEHKIPLSSIDEAPSPLCQLGLRDCSHGTWGSVPLRDLSHSLRQPEGPCEETLDAPGTQNKTPTLP